MQDRKYLSCADTAKLVRKALKEAFPGQKFSVRSHTYAGGASIDVGWVDGPTTKQVDAVIGVFSAKGFDGMIDMAYHYDAWYCPEHGASLASTPGTEGSKGTVAAGEWMPPCLEAEPVSFGSDYVQGQRTASTELEQLIFDDIESALGEPFSYGGHYNAFVQDGVCLPCRGSSEYGSTLFHQVLSVLSVTADRELVRVTS